MQLDNILIDTAEGITTLTINRPEVRNAMNQETWLELATAVRHAEQDSQTKVIVITGAGDQAFVAGADIKWLSQRPALAADIIYASDKARFSEIFANIGLIPDAGGLYFLPRLVGLAKAKELVFTARMVEAEEAERIGLINKVVPADRLMEETMELARKLAAGPGKALGLAKALLNQSTSWDLPTLLEGEALAQGICMQTADFREGLDAFLKKRKPQFRGE